MIYGRSNEEPLSADAEIKQSFYTLCSLLRSYVFVSIDVCFLHRPQRGGGVGGNEKEKSLPPFPLKRTKRIFQNMILPLKGYYWEDHSADALAFTAQLAVLLGHGAQRTPKQTLDAQFGRVEGAITQTKKK